MQQPAKKYYTPEEYLALEEAAEFRSAYRQGEIFAMAGAEIDHSRIVRNLTTKFNSAFTNKNCEAFSNEIRLWIDAVELFTYPDILVICGAPKYYENRRDTITNPLLIIEVLSGSTEKYDRGEKFRFYRSIRTLQEYILVDQYRIHVEHFSKSPDGKWFLTEYNEDDVLRCSSLDFQIVLKEIYDRVEFVNSNRPLR